MNNSMKKSIMRTILGAMIATGDIKSMRAYTKRCYICNKLHGERDKFCSDKCRTKYINKGSK